MPLVEENPITLEIEKPVKEKVKRVYTEEQKLALCERLAKARAVKAEKKAQLPVETPPVDNKKSIAEKTTTGGKGDKSPTIAEKTIDKKQDKVKKIQKKLMKPLPESRKNIPKPIKAQMDNQRRNIEIQDAKKLEMEAVIRQRVALELRKIKKEEERVKRIAEEKAKEEEQADEELSEEEQADEELPEEEQDDEELPEEEYYDYDDNQSACPTEEEDYEYEEEEDDPTPPTPPPPPTPPVAEKTIEAPKVKSTIIHNKPNEVRFHEQVRHPLRKPLPPNVYQRTKPQRKYEYNTPGDVFLQRLLRQ